MRNLIRKLLILTFFSCNTPSANQDIPGPAQKQTVTTISETPAPSKADSTLSFDRYCNARFGYCIEYPRGIAVPQPQPTNGDGRIFLNPQGQEVLRVYGSNNTDPDFGNISLEQQFRNDIRHVKEEKDVSESKITYQKLGKNFFVISGYSRGKLFYQKTILRDEDFAYAILRWASDDTALFRKISNRIFQSFQ